MAFTVDDIFTEFYDRYPQAKNAANARAFLTLNTAEVMIASKFPIRHKTFETTLTLNTQEYPLSAITGASDVVQIFAATYLESAADQGTALKPVDKSYLDQYLQGWRTAEADTPQRFGIVPTDTDRALLLHPKPPASSISGYPKVEFYCSRRKQYTATSDELPATVMNPELYLALMCALYSQTKDRKASTDWFNLAEYWAKDFHLFIFGELPYDRPRIEPAGITWPRYT